MYLAYFNQPRFQDLHIKVIGVVDIQSAGPGGRAV
jgi:hypothetical protein